MDELEKTNRINMLIDIYGDLLTDKQQQYLQMYYEEDLSLSEIAENLDVSRNAVYDQVRRAMKSLEVYEERLGLLEKYIQRRALIAKIEAEENIAHDDLHTYLERLKEM